MVYISFDALWEFRKLANILLAIFRGKRGHTPEETMHNTYMKNMCICDYCNLKVNTSLCVNSFNFKTLFLGIEVGRRFKALHN